MPTLKQVSTADLVPFAANAKLHTDGQIAQIAGSIRSFGLNNPVLIRPDKTIIAGHGRVLAARKLGLETVPCIALNHLTDAQCRPGGTLFFSGRSLDRVDDLMQHRKAAYRKAPHRNVEFLDENNLTALYRKGSWFFQKFHGDEDVDRMCRMRGWDKLAHNKTPIGFNVMAKKDRDSVGLEVRVESLRREFDMPVNRAGRTLGRADDIEKAIRSA